jgi:subtilase family serine protease
VAKHPVPRGRRRRLTQSAVIAAAALAVTAIAGLGAAAQPALAASAGPALALPGPHTAAGPHGIPRAHIPPGLHNVPGLPAVPGLPSTPVRFRHVCGRSTPSRPECFALQRTGIKRVKGPLASTCGANGGYTPQDLASAYNLPTGAGAGETVAIVDAYNDPNAENDLSTYRSDCGLPPCTSQNGCFKKIDENGGTSYPPNDYGWTGEIILDLEMVSAVCPNCHILLVEADDNTWANLDTAENTAAGLAKFVSNSFGAAESAASSSRNPNFDHPGVAITAAAGDSGYQVDFPAAAKTVTAVGGTSLEPAANTRGWDEIAWAGTGSGCSAYQAKPSWQTDPGCTNRMVADVSAVADPDTGVAVYNTYTATASSSGWNVDGGTSVATPIIAAVYALAGPPASGSYPASYLYPPKPGSINDIVAGTNNPLGTCTPTYFCNGEQGYDGPTGWGTPWGTASFAAP